MHLYIYIICSLSIGWLSVGINASAMCLFSVGFISQWWMRTRYPRWFAKYNYILAAALDGGTQVRIRFNFHCCCCWPKFTESHSLGGRYWFSSFRLLSKEPLGNLSCSRNGERKSLIPFASYTFFFL